MTLLRIAVGVLAAAVVGLGVALVVVASNASSDIDRQEGRLAALERRAAESRSGDQAELTALRRDLRRVTDCLPEMQTEIDTLDLDRETLFISPGSQLSRVCQPVIYPQQAGATAIGD
jgi:hypothetical protein